MPKNVIDLERQTLTIIFGSVLGDLERQTLTIILHLLQF